MPTITTKENGMCQVSTDVVKVPAPPGPPVPTPATDMAFCMQANPATCSPTTTVNNQAVLHVMSQIPMSAGDEMGTAGGGLVSGTIKGPVGYMKGSMMVKVDGKPVVMHQSPTKHNGANANAMGGTQTSPSQMFVEAKG